PIKGDGSDRLWFRACHGKKSLVISDHGICLAPSENLSQLQAFVNIGTHLSSKKIAVPKILGHDELSGQVALEDLGNIHLASMVNQNQSTLIDFYKKVIDRLIEFSQTGILNFDTNWTCQTASYSKELILEKECTYFMTSFVRDYLGRNLRFEPYAHEFAMIADNALKYSFDGLMHRDMQSKNIMIHNENIYFIDFQSARKGPLQYDLASLLIDPYVKLPDIIQKELLGYTMSRLGIDSKEKKREFEECYKYCCLTRNLQFLGAFA
ncbi:MAG: phosphotransferase, partial [Desulfobacteraceae bacterium]|nr:phosphotransferase [Desulfobacteraceae bacterium]